MEYYKLNKNGGILQTTKIGNKDYTRINQEMVIFYLKKILLLQILMKLKIIISKIQQLMGVVLIMRNLKN